MHTVWYHSCIGESGGAVMGNMHGAPDTLGNTERQKKKADDILGSVGLSKKDVEKFSKPFSDVYAKVKMERAETKKMPSGFISI
jgi:hypothetical protein